MVIIDNGIETYDSQIELHSGSTFDVTLNLKSCKITVNVNNGYCQSSYTTDKITVDDNIKFRFVITMFIIGDTLKLIDSSSKN